MSKFRRYCASAVLAGIVLANFAADKAHSQDITSRPLAFQAPGSDNGSIIRVPDGDGAKTRFTVVCFLGAECPLARLYGQRLSALEREFAAQGVRFLGVMSNCQDSIDDVRRYQSETALSFPIALDPNGAIADKYGAQRTPEVFVIDDQLQPVYRGRIDDQYAPGIARQAPTKNDLSDALRELVADKPVSNPRTDAIGCHIGRMLHPDAKANTTYTGSARAVLERNCVECHRSGEIGPFALTDYDEIVGWGHTILEAIDDGRMPPWHASPQHGKFANARAITDADKQILRDWISAGMPRGDSTQDSSHTAGSSQVAQGSTISSPDATFAMRDRPFVVPKSGTVEYQYFVLDPGFTTDRWVSAVQIAPGNRSVVHHAIVFIRPPDGGRFRGVGWLGAYVPGQRNIPWLPGHARLVPSGSKLVFQMHYTPNGTRQEDLTRIEMAFMPESQVTHEVFTLAALDQEFEIPPGAPDHPVRAELRSFSERAKLLAIAPHMHLRGKSFRVDTRRGEQSEILLDVPRYDFNWQHSYVLEKPLPLDSVESLEFTAKFDNSLSNPFNPDPTQFVTWGDQTWEEMAVAFFDVAEPRNIEASSRDSRSVAAQADSPTVADSAPPSPTVETRIAQFVDDFFARLDANRDGRVLPSESPLAVKQFSFHRFDADGNRVVTRSEVEQVARKILQ